MGDYHREPNDVVDADLAEGAAQYMRAVPAS